MLKTIIAKSLFISGRINRLDHFLRKLFLLLAQIPITIIAIIIIGFVAKLVGEPAQMGMSITIDFFFIILFLIYAYVFGLLWNVVTVLRLHDMNLDGRWCIFNFVIFIPMVLFLFRIIVPKPGQFPLSYSLPISLFVLFNLIILFAKGSPGENFYGPPPGEESAETQTQKTTKRTPKTPGKAPTQQPKSVPRTTPNPYAGHTAPEARPQAGVARPTPGNGIARSVDKNFLKHNDRYKPKTARKK